MRIIVTGGGTAGHVNAGITILDEFKRKNPQGNFLFIGTKRGLEKDLIPRAGYDIKFIRARGLNRESIPVLAYSLCLIPLSVIHSLFILLSFNPDAVIGVGGFASGPFILASAFLRKPIFLLEQNAVMGFTNRILIRFAKKIFVAFPLANIKNKDAGKVVVCGNPVRSSIKPASRYNASGAGSNDATATAKNITFNIFVFGGSQGARAINNCIVSAMALLNNIGGIKITHQAGKLDYEKVKDAYKNAKFENSVHDYIHGIDKIYDETDIVISRAGASTIFELLASKVPSILVPLPTAADNHQYFNARFLSDHGACELIEQKNITPEFLVQRIMFYKENREALKVMNRKLIELSKVKQRPEEIITNAVKGFINA